VQHAGVVGGLDRLGRLAHDPDRLALGQRALAAEPRGQRVAGHVVHDDVDPPAVGLEGADGHDPRVGHAGRGPGLAAKALGRDRARIRSEEDLDRDGVPELRIAGQVDGAEAAPPELPLEHLAPDSPRPGAHAPAPVDRAGAAVGGVQRMRRA